jgi:hypothetical protein
VRSSSLVGRVVVVVVTKATSVLIATFSPLLSSASQRTPRMARTGPVAHLDRLQTLKLITGQQGLYTATYPITTDPEAVDVLSTAPAYEESRRKFIATLT